jgi:hypothetical protein
MNSEKYQRFSNLSYDDFRELAKDQNLSRYEKIGFPNEYREGKEDLIFNDIKQKLPRLSDVNQVVLDVGPGCSDLPFMLIEQCRKSSHRLLLADSDEMLSQIPDQPFTTKYAGIYPGSIYDFDQLRDTVDVIIIYSVLHYIYAEGNIYSFLDKSLSLLSPGGQMLIGDIPNLSKRKRFFCSEAGKNFHKAFTKAEADPLIEFNKIEEGQIDDSVAIGLVTRARMQGFDAYILPQNPSLPMANRREDILIVRP